MSSIADQLGSLTVLNHVTVPDLWQQEAVTALRAGKDVVVHAPTGAGKTLVFELWSNQGKNRGQAIYTVPTRALANDKLAEWRGRGWNVGIATGDIAENLHAPVLVATLETQKNRLIKGEGPSLLVVDEYQMLGDHDRGLNYELAIALAPPQTQLLLLSGSVANPHHLVQWLTRLGRKAELIRSDHRPVPLEEVHTSNLSYSVPSEIRGYWPRFAAKALAEDLGPILIFAPRRQAAESMAAELARYLPNPNPLQLTQEQKLLVGEHLARLLKSRIAYHHSGLSYGARAGVIEPLAKAGQLRIVVATMGLAAGINFSLRSVALAGDSYRRDNQEQPLRADEILQMFGRAGRRGLDETGYVLISANELRLMDARPAHLSRGGLIDWSALLGIMSMAAEMGKDPFMEAVRVQERLFTTKPIFLGVEESLRHPLVPCGLRTDPERARHVRKRVRQMLNSQGEWETFPPLVEKKISEIVYEPRKEHPGNSADELNLQTAVKFRPVVTEPRALERIGTGMLCVLAETPDGVIYGRTITVADRLSDGKVLIAKWIRRLIEWQNRQATEQMFDQQIAPRIEQKLAAQRLQVARFRKLDHKIVADASLGEMFMRVPVDSHGVPIWKPREREVLPPDCAVCDLVPVCRELPTSTGVALLWRRLKLIDQAGVPTLRGRIVSFFQQEDGLAIAAALEDNSYPIEELLYDLANLDAGFRFCGEENRWAGRLAMACHQTYGLLTVPGYLENGAPPRYGAGADQIVAAVHKNPAAKQAWISDLVGAGDIDRVIIEWRSLLRQISNAPELNWPRWSELQRLAEETLDETESPTLKDLPPLDFSQTRRVDHRLILRRH
ncbi:MAG: DEAD/DEAH box helicase [Verrucomicrobiota bacterium]|nr:DEAD/DEAH box helicase [Verrucomicrobiota bacterium]